MHCMYSILQISFQKKPPLSFSCVTVTRVVLTVARIPVTSVMVKIVTCIHRGSAGEFDWAADWTAYSADPCDGGTSSPREASPKATQTV